ncbi:MAG: hypothetical protein EOP39_20265 [Rubrivivax sp.]|nr:MAG: hypothetical protein EOP39_20265 [Rubrivivax sp.]
MGGGYLNQKERKRRNDQDDEDRAQRRQLIGMQMDEKQAALHSQQAVRDAGADRVVQDGNAGPMPEGQLVRMGGNGYASKEEAGTAAAPLNTPEAKADRQMSTLMQMDPVKGVALKGAMTQAKEQERQIKLDAKLQEVGGLLARGGWGAVPEIYDRYDDGMSAKVEPDGKGGATVITLGKDGKELRRKAYTHESELFGEVVGGFDPKLWLARKDKQDAASAAAADKASDNARADRQLGMQERYYGLLGDAASTRADKAGGSSAERMDEADKLRYTGLSKQIDDINSAMIKAQAEGSWDEASPNAQALKRNLASLRMQSSDIMGKYSGQAQTDPLGIRKTPTAPQPQAPGGMQVSKAVQAERDKGSVAMVQAELQRAREAGDSSQVEALTTELRGMGVTVGPSAMTPAPAATPAKRPAMVQMGGGSGRAAPPAPTTADILAGPSKGNALLDKMAATKAAPIDQAMAQFKTAQAQFQGAAKSGDPRAVAAYQPALVAAQSALDALLRDVPETQRKAILAQVGI